MQPTKKGAEREAESRGRGYEVRDAWLKPLAWIGALLAVIIAGTIVFMVPYLKSLEKDVAKKEGPVSPLAQRELPPSPRLEVSFNETLKQVQAYENKRLNSYGWVNRSLKRVHIPIDRAIDLAVAHGLPAPQEAPTQGAAVGSQPSAPGGATGTTPQKTLTKAGSKVVAPKKSPQPEAKP